MARSPKPFRWRDGWYTDAGGPRTLLLPGTASRRDAEKELRRLLNERDQHCGTVSPTLTVSELFALFLDTVRVENDPATYDCYQRGLTRFALEHGAEQARRITKLDAQNFKNRLTATVSKRTKNVHKPRTINSTLIALTRCWNWAIDSEAFGLTNSPFRKIKLLPEEGRQRVMIDEEFQALMRNSDACFRRVLLSVRYMPIRPEDLRTLRWQGENYVEFDSHCWVIGKDKTSGTRRNQKPKIVMMPPFIEKLLRWLEARSTSPFVFLNGDGVPWTRNALGLRMRRLRKRAGIQPDANGEQIVLYTNRHTCLTRGATVMTPAELQAYGGHTGAHRL